MSQMQPCNFKLNTQLSWNIGIKFSLNSYKKKKDATTWALPGQDQSLPTRPSGVTSRSDGNVTTAGRDNTVMLKEPLRSPVSVLKNLKAGTSKIHRNSLLPLRTFKLCKKNKNKETQQGRNLNSETQCKSQIWWFSEWHWGFLWGRGRVVRDGFSCWPLCLTGFHLPHPAALLYSVLHLWKWEEGRKMLPFKRESCRKA